MIQECITISRQGPGVMHAAGRELYIAARLVITLSVRRQYLLQRNFSSVRSDSLLGHAGKNFLGGCLTVLDRGRDVRTAARVDHVAVVSQVAQAGQLGF